MNGQRRAHEHSVELLAADQADFVAFKGAYNLTNGVAAFETMIASLPEPASLTLLAFAGGLLTLVRKRQ